MTTCFDFVDVKIKNEKLQARPIAWDQPIVDGFGNGPHGQPVKPTEFHATCPYCGNLIHFTIDDFYRDFSGATNNIKCLTCKAGSLPVETGKPREFEVFPRKIAFIDPISEGLFDIEVDSELLKQLDSLKLGQTI